MSIKPLENEAASQPWPLSQLCVQCRYLCEGWDEHERDEKLIHWSNYPRIQKSAQNGCSLCYEIMLGLSEAEKRPLEEQAKIDAWDCPIEVTIPKFHDEINVMFMTNSPGGRILTISSSQVMLFEADSGKSCLLLNSPSTSILPSRLLYVGDDKLIHLCSPKDLDHRPRYATLSHCWGLEKVATLNKSNLDRFNTNIPLEQLPKTFLDAIYITKHLGLCYLWIDSLCIIQDDAADWERESLLMGSVYGGSTVNITASAATDGTKGCFQDRAVSQCVVKLRTKGRDGVTRCFSDKTYDRHMNEMPLVKRGWCLQERMLAHRTPHFTSTEVFWECYELVASEYHPQKFSSLLGSESFFKKAPVGMSQWSWIMKYYSQCQVTYPTDKLMAIAGLAEAVQQQTKDEYIAGMWRNDIEFQLCWKVKHSEITTNKAHHKRRPDQYIAPSWSWISALYEVDLIPYYELPEVTRRLFINIIDIQTTPTGDNSLGPISSGKLSISCKFLIRYAGDLEQLTDSNGVQYYSMALDNFTGRLTFDDFDTIPCPIYILPAVWWSTLVYGLILTPTGLARGQYRRIGHCSLTTYGSDMRILTPNSSTDPGEDECVSIDLNEWYGFCYSITII